MLTTLLSQTNNSFDVIVCNDGSTDGTTRVVNSFVSRFQEKGVSLLLLDKDNGGVSSAINKMLPLIHTDYFVPCDCDDWYDLNVVEQFYNLLDGIKSFSLASMSVRFYYENGEIKRTASFTTNDTKSPLFNRFVYADKIPCYSGIFIYNFKDFLEYNGTNQIFESRYGQNWQLILPMVRNTNIVLLKNCFYNVLSRKNSLSHKTTSFSDEYNRLVGYCDILSNVLTKLGAEDIRDERIRFYNRLICNICFKEKKRNLFLKHYNFAAKSFRLLIKKIIMVLMIWKK